MSIRHGNLILERGARTTINVDRRGNLSVVLPISLPPGFEIEESASKPKQPQIYEKPACPLPLKRPRKASTPVKRVEPICESSTKNEEEEEEISVIAVFKAPTRHEPAAEIREKLPSPSVEDFYVKKPLVKPSEAPPWVVPAKVAIVDPVSSEAGSKEAPSRKSQNGTKTSWIESVVTSIVEEQKGEATSKKISKSEIIRTEESSPHHVEKTRVVSKESSGNETSSTVRVFQEESTNKLTAPKPTPAWSGSVNYPLMEAPDRDPPTTEPSSSCSTAETPTEVSESGKVRFVEAATKIVIKLPSTATKAFKTPAVNEPTQEPENKNSPSRSSSAKVTPMRTASIRTSFIESSSREITRNAEPTKPMPSWTELYSAPIVESSPRRAVEKATSNNNGASNGASITSLSAKEASDREESLEVAQVIQALDRDESAKARSVKIPSNVDSSVESNPIKEIQNVGPAPDEAAYKSPAPTATFVKAPKNSADQPIETPAKGSPLYREHTPKITVPIEKKTTSREPLPADVEPVTEHPDDLDPIDRITAIVDAAVETIRKATTRVIMAKELKAQDKETNSAIQTKRSRKNRIKFHSRRITSIEPVIGIPIPATTIMVPSSTIPIQTATVMEAPIKLPVQPTAIMIPTVEKPAKSLPTFQEIMSKVKKITDAAPRARIAPIRPAAQAVPPRRVEQDYVITDLNCPRANSIESTSGTDTTNDDDEIPFVPAFDVIEGDDPDRHFSWVDDLKRIMFNFYITTEPKPYNPNDYPRPKPRPRSPSSEGVHRRKRPRRDRKDIVYPKKAIRRKICQICYAVYADQRVKHRNELCLPCAAFYQDSISKFAEYYCIKSEDGCPILDCKKCRYDRCVEIGLTPECIVENKWDLPPMGTQETGPTNLITILPKSSNIYNNNNNYEYSRPVVTISDSNINESVTIPADSEISSFTRTVDISPESTSITP
ncbi:hypothetical protein WR25_27132 [Diploscapter pachys]|uniref:Nuclear receptor domain-containing protein n=1 Tax=Diploscapter pachys TaxID=2018661 RepID=A0A2A2KUH5_9BILA|nr:hypothetical protein WR25_27132 [Diploscapter pachys]